MPAAVTPLAGVEAALARTAEVNPVVNALCLVDAEAARERARELEARLERGEDTGPLTGWTFTVKDAMRQAGYPCTAGSRALMDSYPEASTACVARLEAAGAIAIGRSNVPEFCYRGTTRNELYGQTGNPFAPDRSAGGSSGGARQRARARRRRAGARLRRRRLDPHSRVVLRHRRAQADLRPRAARARHAPAGCC